MNHYLNFTLIGEDGRFHVLLPWQNAHAVGFNAIDAHLQRVVSEEVFDRTRQLKVSEQQPEADSRDFHVWQPQQTLQRLSCLVGENTSSMMFSTPSCKLAEAVSTCHERRRVI